MADQAMSIPPVFESAKRVYAGALALRNGAMMVDVRTGGKLGVGDMADKLIDKYFFSPISQAGTAAINAPLKGILPHFGLETDNPNNFVQQQEVRTALHTIATVELVDTMFDAFIKQIPKEDINMLVSGLHEIGPFQQQLEDNLVQMNERTMICRAQAAAELHVESVLLAEGNVVDPTILEQEKQGARKAAEEMVKEKIRNHELFVPTDHIEMPDDSRTLLNMLPIPKRLMQGIAMFLGGALTLRYRLSENPIFQPFYKALSPVLDLIQKEAISQDDAVRNFDAHFSTPTDLAEALYNPTQSGLDSSKALAIYEMAIPDANGQEGEPVFAALRAKPKFKGNSASKEDEQRYNIACTGRTLAYMQSFYADYTQLMQKHNGIIAFAKEAAAGMIEQAGMDGAVNNSELLNQQDHQLTADQLRQFFIDWLEEPQGLNSSLPALQESFRDALSSGEPNNSAMAALHIIRDQMIDQQDHRTIFNQAVADVAKQHNNPYFKLSEDRAFAHDHSATQEKIIHLKDTAFTTPGALLHSVLHDDVSRKDISLAQQSLSKNHPMHSKTTFAQAKMDKEFESDYLASTLQPILEKADHILAITQEHQDSKSQKREFSKRLKRMDADIGSSKLSDGQINEELFAISLAMHWMNEEAQQHLTSILKGMEAQKEFQHIRYDDVTALLAQGRTHSHAGMETFKSNDDLSETIKAESGKATQQRQEKIQEEAQKPIVQTSAEDARDIDETAATLS